MDTFCELVFYKTQFLIILFFFIGNCVKITAIIINAQPKYSRTPKTSPRIIAPLITLNKDSDDKVITDDYAKGYAFFDDVTIETITKEDYEAGTATNFIKKIDVVANNAAAEQEKEDDSTSTTTLGAGEIITIVSASLLSVATIAVVIVVLVKKVAPKVKESKNKKFKKPGYNKRNAKVATKDDLDKFKD